MQERTLKMDYQGPLNIFHEDYYRPTGTQPVARPHTAQPCGLLQSVYGITSNGLNDQNGNRPHIHPWRFRRGEEATYRGKRHIDPLHINISDDAKRAEGRLGKAHVRDTPQSRGATSLSLYPIETHENNQDHMNSASRNAREPMQKRLVPHASTKTTSTSIQLSEARLREIAHNNPRYASTARETIAQHRGEAFIVAAEEKLSRRIASEEYAAGSQARCAAMAKEQSAKSREGLGDPAEAIRDHVPYAFDASAPRPDTRREARSARDPNAESKPAPERVAAPHRRVDKRHFVDHISLADNAYPDPPPVGVRVQPRPIGRTSAMNRESTMCADEYALRRAQAKRQYGTLHASLQQRMGGESNMQYQEQRNRRDFIFGIEPPPPAQRMTLRGQTEARWKVQDERLAERRTGKAVTPQSHKRTSLW